MRAWVQNLETAGVAEVSVGTPKKETKGQELQVWAGADVMSVDNGGNCEGWGTGAETAG